MTDQCNVDICTLTKYPYNCSQIWVNYKKKTSSRLFIKVIINKMYVATIFIKSVIFLLHRLCFLPTSLWTEIEIQEMF